MFLFNSAKSAEFNWHWEKKYEKTIADWYLELAVFEWFGSEFLRKLLDIDFPVGKNTVFDAMFALINWKWWPLMQ